jgi:hypothetical protein
VAIPMKLSDGDSTVPGGKSRSSVSAINDSTGTPRRAASACSRRSTSSGRSTVTDTPQTYSSGRRLTTRQAPRAALLTDGASAAFEARSRLRRERFRPAPSCPSFCPSIPAGWKDSTGRNGTAPYLSRQNTTPAKQLDQPQRPLKVETRVGIPLGLHELLLKFLVNGHI